MTYNEFIENIKSTSGQWNIPDGEYYEVHHILPKCMGGEPKTSPRKKKHDNLIWLYPQEHYEAHKLLFEENPDSIGLALCWRNFHQRKASKNCPDIVLISGDEYARLQEEYHRLQHIRLSGENSPSFGKKKSPETILKIKEAKRKQDAICPPHLGKKHSEDTKRRLSESAKMQFKDNPPGNAQRIIDLYTGIEYKSIKDCIKFIIDEFGSSKVQALNRINGIKTWNKELNKHEFRRISE